MGSYQPPPHLSVVLSGSLANNRDVAFSVEAVRKQLREHVAPAWNLVPPGVFMYSVGQFTPASEGAVIAIVDDDGDDEAAGFHSELGNVPFGLVDTHQSESLSRVLSHEAIELFVNKDLDWWELGPNGLEYAVEPCDPVQEIYYYIDAEIFGERRSVEVSDFVEPLWFVDTTDQGWTEISDTHWEGSPSLRPYEVATGGYAIARRDGKVLYMSHAKGAHMPARKLAKWGRTRRLIEGGDVRARNER